MRPAQSECPSPDRRRLSAVISDDRARCLLGHLQSGPATPADLAQSLAAAERDCQPAAVPPDVRRRYRRLLYHDYLPRLGAADLIERTADGLVRLRPVRTDSFAVPLPDFDEPADPSWTAAAAVLARRYRYRLLVVLVDAAEPVSLSPLAADLFDADPEAATGEAALAVALHHVDLPKLAEVDLVVYDPDAKVAAATPAAESLL